MNKITSEEKILKSALKEFATYGYEGARVDRIAKRARINKAMIYYHFKGKEAVYETILLNTYKSIFSNVINAIPGDKEPNEQVYVFFENFLDFIGNIDSEFIIIMLRELSSGGKYFKKLAIQNVIMPAMNTMNKIFDIGTKKNVLKDLNPIYSTFQIMGPVIFFNLLRVTLQGTEIGEVLFKGDFFNDFKDNYLTILKSGIEK